MKVKMAHPVILVIAAGQSKRLGRPKQLLTFDGEFLINRLLHRIEAAGPSPIILVLGANSELIQEKLDSSTAEVVLNTNWQTGMAGSINTGVKYIQQQHPNADGIMIVVCDQPFLETTHINALLELQLQTERSIVASYYAGIAGTPVLFHAIYFEALLKLTGDNGAKKIVQEYPDEVARLLFEEAAIDIDTEEDYQKLLNAALPK